MKTTKTTPAVPALKKKGLKPDTHITVLLSMMAFVAQREDIDLHDTTITYEKEMASKPVSRVGKITLHIVVQSSRPLDDALRAKLEAAARACPVRQSLHPDVDVVEHFEYLV